jgi:hypothetical protein
MTTREAETSHERLTEEELQQNTAPQRFNLTHRAVLLFVIAVQLCMIGKDFVLSRQQQSAPVESMTSPDTKQRVLSNFENEYRIANGKGNVRDGKRLRELMPNDKSTKAPSIKSTKAPSFKSTKAPSIKSAKKRNKSRDEPTVSFFPTETPTSSPTAAT